jgi:hypothetical protein
MSTQEEDASSLSFGKGFFWSFQIRISSEQNATCKILLWD